ncbi:MAG: caspase family protein, partial [Deltaproteobacteria bacterium]
MKTRFFQIRFLFSLTFWLGVSLVGSAFISAQTRAVKPVRIEAKTAQNETISYIYAESHALVIGVSQYRNGWSNLPGVQDDVEEVSQSLKANGFEVTTIEDPGLDELENAIEDFIFEKGTNPENRLLIYYAGHGHTMTLGYGGEMGFLVPADAPVPQKGRDAKFRRQALSMQRIEEVAKNTSAKHVLFMFDACFAGSVFLATRAAPAYIQQNTKEPVRQFITSGSAEQEVPDKSIFRRAFVDALNGKADYDKDGYLTGTELGAYIQKRTAEDWEGKLTPQYGKLQDPNLNKGDFVFELSKPLKEKSPPAEPAPVAPPPDLAAQAWSMIENSENPAIFSAFIEKFPDAPQRQLAELKLMLLPSPSAEPKQEVSTPEVTPAESKSEPVAISPDPLPSQPVEPPEEQITMKNSSGSNNRYRWTDEIVEDKEKKLIWQRQEVGEKSYVEAQQFCEGLQLAGASNWRLPWMSELRELNRQVTSDSAVYKEIFNQPMDSFFWSGALTDMGTRVWTINLWTGRA